MPYTITKKTISLLLSRTSPKDLEEKISELQFRTVGIMGVFKTSYDAGLAPL